MCSLDGNYAYIVTSSHTFFQWRNVITLTHPQGTATIEELGDGKRRIRTRSTKASALSSCETYYSVDLISFMVQTLGTAFLCGEIVRDEDPNVLETYLLRSILAYVPEDLFRNRRLLDFGCGCGSSTIILARKFPKTEIVGIDLQSDHIKIAEARSRFYRFEDRVSFCVSLDSSNLPEGIGKFDFVVLSAVYEHLLPAQRFELLRELWKILKPSGILFVNGTPYRYFPIEIHTTEGLPLINYLPDRVTSLIARRYSKRVALDESWTNLLRRGIRGATEREILSNIRKACGKPVPLSPTHSGYKDKIDLLFIPPSETCGEVLTSAPRARLLACRIYGSRILRYTLKCILKITGIAFLHSVTLAVQKEH